MFNAYYAIFSFRLVIECISCNPLTACVIKCECEKSSSSPFSTLISALVKQTAT